MEYFFLILIMLFSLVIHEVSHGAMANYLGDPTAKYAGRLTLNPLKHLDLFGSIILPLLLILMRSPFLIGWAKPVPINPYNFRHPRWDSAKVALVGPWANLLVALIFGIFGRILPLAEKVKEAIINAFFSRDIEILSSLLKENFFGQLFLIFSFIVFLNVLWAIFNLIPIPPLDGSHILFAFFPPFLEDLKIFLQQYSIFILFIFLYLIIFGIIPLFSLTMTIFKFIILGS